MPPGSEVVYCRSKKPAELLYMTFIQYTLADQKVQKIKRLKHKISTKNKNKTVHPDLKVEFHL